MLSVEHVTKTYGSFTALEDISLTFTPGVYGLLAPNGAGKTTLIKMLTTLLFPTRGQILWDGEDIQALGAEYRGLLGYLPQQFGYYPNYTPRQFLRYAAALQCIPRREAGGRIDHLLETVGLRDVADKKMKKFSGGMLQRVGIATAMLNDPQLLILDEPTAGLDPQERIHIRNFISRISANRIVILATHVVQDIAGIAKEIILLGNGKVRMQGTPDEICSSLDGRVWEVRIPAGKASEISEQYLVSNLLEERSGMVQARLISETEPVIPEAAKAVPAPAGIEDVYLSLFDHRKEGRR